MSAPAPPAAGFSAAVYQNEFLPAGATEVNAVLTVTASGEAAASAVAPPDKAVLLIVDTSGSMENPPSKIRAARRAASTACQMLPDGTWFALVSASTAPSASTRGVTG